MKKEMIMMGLLSLLLISFVSAEIVWSEDSTKVTIEEQKEINPVAPPAIEHPENNRLNPLTITSIIVIALVIIVVLWYFYYFRDTKSRRRRVSGKPRKSRRKK